MIYFCAYQVSSWGRVRRAKEVISKVNAKGLGISNWYGSYTRVLKPKLLKTTNIMREKYKGFTAVSIKDITYPVHRLVARVFLPETYKPELTVNHKDGNRFNNCVDNLEWVTSSENEKHSYAVLGKQPWNKGLKGVMPKKWRRERKEAYDIRNHKIWEDKQAGLSIKELVEKYSLGERYLYQIINEVKSNG